MLKTGYKKHMMPEAIVQAIKNWIQAKKLNDCVEFRTFLAVNDWHNMWNNNAYQQLRKETL